MQWQRAVIAASPIYLDEFVLYDWFKELTVALVSDGTTHAAASKSHSITN